MTKEKCKCRDEKIQFLIENSQFFMYAEPSLRCVPDHTLDKYCQEVEENLKMNKSNALTESSLDSFSNEALQQLPS
ncbi:MAG: hypothetical protein M3Q58_10805 [Bacteroidota bacterium]|nr:hypothetical protein [Bacteroidota bacterium]